MARSFLRFLPPDLPFMATMCVCVGVCVCVSCGCACGWVAGSSSCERGLFSRASLADHGWRPGRHVAEYRESVSPSRGTFSALQGSGVATHPISCRPAAGSLQQGRRFASEVGRAQGLHGNQHWCHKMPGVIALGIRVASPSKAMQEDVGIIDRSDAAERQAN